MFYVVWNSAEHSILARILVKALHNFVQCLTFSDDGHSTGQAQVRRRCQGQASTQPISTHHIAQRLLNLDHSRP